jgi:hypothetical protein
MSTWSEAATQIKAWQSVNPSKSKCFMITAGDIASLNAQVAGGLNALRIYLGQDANGNITAFFVGCIDDGSGNYNDYNIPSNQANWNTAVNNNTLPLKKDARPCPVNCSSNNYLNS